MSGHLQYEDPFQKHAETFVNCRVGIELQQFDEDLGRKLHKYDIGRGHAEFIVTPMVSPRSVYRENIDNLSLLTDLIIPSTEWMSRIAVSITYKPNPLSEADDKFETLFDHAIYLPTQVVVIDCPDHIGSQSVVAKVVNDRLKNLKSRRPLVLFRIQLGASSNYSHQEIKNFNLNVVDESSSPNSDDTNSMESGYLGQNSPHSQIGQTTLGMRSGIFVDDWAKWNSLRQQLLPDPRIGVCLTISRDLDLGHMQSQRWFGEPVRMITISCDRFVSQKNCEGSTRLAGRVREFIADIMLANSLLTAVVIQVKPNCDAHPYLRYLSHMCTSFDLHNRDQLRAWNDTLLVPLQPLSNNLDSRTYEIFEMDKTKYIRYQDAMIEALKFVTQKTKLHRIHIMVLGAGRGPLVDALIEAIKGIHSRKEFKVYALDKNNSSVQSLRYKQATDWSRAPKNIKTVVVKADMRYWTPQEPADLISTELLGSFSDNELSPECIDGVWRFSKPETVCIPQAYTSYIAPISSLKLYQNLSNLHDEKVYDQIHVSRLSNIYTISEPQPLFTFEHYDLAKKPMPGANKRHARLVFTTPIDTICHGFAGYFSSKLFGNTSISTVPNFRTNCMDSWFPTYIPLEKPVQLSAGSELEISFSRKESDSHVWYEWTVIRPEMSRVHSFDGRYSAMSKFV